MGGVCSSLSRVSVLSTWEEWRRPECRAGSPSNGTAPGPKLSVGTGALQTCRLGSLGSGTHLKLYLSGPPSLE